MTDPVPTPLDVAVEFDEIERYKFALSLAARYGQPESFADRLRGDTTEELAQDAQDLAETIMAIRTANAEPEHVPAVDPSQGLGFSTPRKTPAETFGELIFNRLT